MGGRNLDYAKESHEKTRGAAGPGVQNKTYEISLEQIEKIKELFRSRRIAEIFKILNDLDEINPENLLKNCPKKLILKDPENKKTFIDLRYFENDQQ